MYVTLVLRKISRKNREALKSASRVAPPATKVPGFKAYYVIDLGGDKYASITFFKDKKGADTWAALAKKFVQQKRLAKFFDELPEEIPGVVGKIVYGLPK